MPSGVYKRIKPNHWLGKKHKEISKIRIGLKLKGKIPWNKNLKGFMKGRITPEETKQKIKLSNLGKKRSEETKKKMRGKRPNFHGNSISFRKGHIPWSKGKKGIFKQSESFKEERRKKWLGKNNPNWTGGLMNMRDKHSLFNPEYYEWRTKVFTRDEFKCKMCSSKDKLQAHHILDWKNYPELRYDINNGITLCISHHPRGREKEKLMSPYFQELISQIN